MSSTNEKIIKIEARHVYTMFPNAKSGTTLGEGEDTYGVVKWYNLKTLEGKVKDDGFGEITVTGHYRKPIENGVKYTILAKETQHEVYGVQYQLIFCGEIVDLSQFENQRIFLKSFMTDGQIEEFFKVHNNPLEVIQNGDIEGLKKVHGVGNYIAERILERFEENKDYCKVYMELDELGLTPNFIQKLVSLYKSPDIIIDKVKNEPYTLAYEMDGVGFKTADDIALKGGLSPKCKERVEAFIMFHLETYAQTGNSYTTAGQLTAEIFNAFGGKQNILEFIDTEDIDENGNVVKTNNITLAIETLKKKKLLVYEDDPNVKKAQRRVYLTKYYNLEKEIADKLILLNYDKGNFEFDDWKKTISSVEKKQGWKFTEEQYDGIQKCLDNNVVFITGSAGTGKTTVLTGALHALGAYKGNYSFTQCALSGKASARMQEVTGAEGQTIHRLLGFKPSDGFTKNHFDPLFNDIIVLDEISMCGGTITQPLLDAISQGKKLIVLGDMGQLESLSSMNIAQDMYDSALIPVAELTKIHRQAEKSGGIVASMKIRHGETVFDDSYEGEFTMGELKDMHFDVSQESETTADRVMRHYKKYWEDGKVKDIMDIQVLTSTRERGNASVFDLNNHIQKYINPKSNNKKECKVKLTKEKSFIIREGDKVMNIKNNYKRMNDRGESNIQVFNGWEGIVKRISDYGKVKIYFPIIDDTILFSTGELKTYITLGYASTTHKYQGSSAKYVIGAIDYSTPPNMLTREILYTLITRMELECTFVCQAPAFNKAVRTSGVKSKKTFLRELLDYYYRLNPKEQENYIREYLIEQSKRVNPNAKVEDYEQGRF